MTRWKAAAPALALLLLPVACARLPLLAAMPGTVPGAEARLRRAAAALDTGAYGPATADLLALARAYPGRAVGRRALLLAAAAQLDPRNPTRQPARGLHALARYLSQGRNDAEEPAQVLYLLALDVADSTAVDTVASVRDTASAAPRARRLPQLPGPTLMARLGEMARDRARLAEHVRELEAEHTQLLKAFADTVKELERVRRTVRP